MKPAQALAEARQGAEGVAVILSANPIHDTGGGQRSAQLALELLDRGWAVVFVSHGVVTETVDLRLRFDQPRLIQWTLRAAVEDESRRALVDALAEGGGVVVTQVPVPEWMTLLREASEGGVPTVYDCIDRWESELGRGWYDRDVEAEVARASGSLVASAPVLVDHVEELTGRRVELVPNAFNSRIFRGQRREESPRPSAFPEEGRVALYVGALWGGWMDWALVKSAATAHPGTTFVFVGDHRGEGRGLPPNCVFTGLLPQTDLPDVLTHADVAFLPWSIDGITEATSPLKVYEFVAMGLPVVAPEIEPLRGIPGVRTERETAGFVGALGEVERDGLDATERRAMEAFARENSWTRRVDDLLRIAVSQSSARAAWDTRAARDTRASRKPAERRRACISVVVPAYNHERFIGRALDSVAGQTLPPGGIVVVDDGSDDGTADRVEEHSAPALHLVRQENRGAHNALNRPVRLAQGDWIAVLNSDDAWEPERLERAWAVGRESGAALLVGSVRLVDGEGGEVDPEHEIARWYREAVEWARESRSLPAVLARHNIGVTTSNFFFHRALWERLGGFRAYRYVHDYDFILRALEVVPRRVVYEPQLEGVLYRVHAANTITDGGAAQRERETLMASLRRPLGRARRRMAAWRDRGEVTRRVRASSVLEPVTRGAAGGERPPMAGSGPPTRGLRVGLVVDSLGLGGLEEVVGLLAQSLPAVGVEVAVACVRRGGAVAQRLTAAGVDVTVMDGRLDRLPVWLSERGIAAVNSHFAPLDAVEVLADAGVPVVETVQNCYAWLDDRGWDGERRRAEMVAGVVAVSGTVAAYHERRTGRRAEWTIPNAVHPARVALPPRAFARRALGLPNEAPVLAFVGRITEQKNPAGLLAAFDEARREIPEAVLLLAGPADNSASLPSLGRRHGATFRYGGLRQRLDVRHPGTVLAAADAYVSNAFYEGWSVAASEAVWAGLPLVLSETGGGRPLVGISPEAAESVPLASPAEGTRGYLVPNPCGDPLSVDARAIASLDESVRDVNVRVMARAMVDVVRELPVWRSRALEARAWARKELAPEVIARRYAEMFLEVAGGGVVR